MATAAAAGAGNAAAVRPIRPRELEDALNFYLYHPLAWRLALLLARTRATPNLVSVAGAATVVAAGVAYAGPLWGLAWPASAALGLALHMAWHVLDGADGDLARLTGAASPRGELVDGLCDYLGHVVLYLLLGALLAREIGAAAWPIMLGAGIAHAVQANHVESQRRFYLRWVHGRTWLHHRQPEARGLLAGLVSLYLAVARGLSPASLAVDAAVTAASDDPQQLDRLRALVRQHYAPLLALQKWLGPNSRAIVLGLSMGLTAGPLLYFAYGGLWMSLLLALSVILHDRAARRIVAGLAAFD